MKVRTTPSATCKEVLYRSETRSQGKGGTYEIWVVEVLDCRDYALSMGARTSEEAMRARAEMLARFLNIPMRDIASGDNVVRQPEELDMPLAQVMKHRGKEITVSSMPPEGSRILVERAPHYVRYVLPPVGISVATIGGVLFMIIWTGFALFWTLGVLSMLHRMKPHGCAIIMPFVGLFFVIIGLNSFRYFVMESLARGEVVITPQSIRVSSLMGSLPVRAREIPLQKVEEVTGGAPASSAVSDTHRQRLIAVTGSMGSILLSSFKPVRIASDVGILKTGGSLQAADSRWLRESIRAEIFRFSGNPLV